MHESTSKKLRRARARLRGVRFMHTTRERGQSTLPNREKSIVFTGDFSQADHHEHIEALRWYHCVPIVSFVYNFAFDVTMTPDELEKLLNLCGLRLSL